LTQEINKLRLFRQNAINNLNVFNEVQSSFKIIQPPAWMWIIISILLLIAVMLWGLFGNVMMDVPARGIILPANSQIIPVFSEQPGSVEVVYVRPGSQVKKGKILAYIKSPYLDEDLQYLKAKHDESYKLLSIYKNHYNEEKEKLTEQYEQAKQLHLISINNQNEKLQTLNKLFINKYKLYKKHILTIVDIQNAKEACVTTQENLNKLKFDYNNLYLNYKHDLQNLDEKLNISMSQYQSIKHEFDIKQLEKQNGSKIISFANGTIIGCNISKGDFVTPGKTLFTLMTKAESNNQTENLEALVFLSHNDAKNVIKGMTVYILPSILTAYDYGYIKGQVISISDYPASKESVNAYLGNMDFVNDFFASGAPYMAKIKLITNRQTESGLMWTTKRGAPLKIDPGTFVTARIIRNQVSPLRLLTK